MIVAFLARLGIPRAVMWALAALAVLGALWWLYSALTANPKAEARLGRNQAEAALQNGVDAVGSVGKQQASEAATDILTRENDSAIRSAPGASAPVDPAVRDAWLRSVCKRRSSRGDPKCVQFAPTP